MISADLQLPPTRSAALAATVAIHLALLFCWQLAQRAPQRHDDGPRQAIQWLWLPRPSTAPVATPPSDKVREQLRAASRPRDPVPPAQTPLPPVPIAPPGPDAAATPMPNAEAMLEQAKRSVAGIDKELRKESRGLISAPADTPQIRMRKGMEKASELAPNRWYEAPKVSEIIDPGTGYDRKRYRVTTANGTYCVTYESNHAPDGLDIMKNGIKPKLTNCPPHEQPATRQEW
jgi:hypothetical protein